MKIVKIEGALANNGEFFVNGKSMFLDKETINNAEIIALENGENPNPEKLVFRDRKMLFDMLEELEEKIRIILNEGQNKFRIHNKIHTAFRDFRVYELKEFN